MQATRCLTSPIACKSKVPAQGPCSRRSFNVGLAAVAFPQHRASMACAATSKDLLVVGPGVLGSVLGKQWHDNQSSSTVVGQTNTTNSHDRLRAMGLTPRLKEEADGTRYPFVLFSAPPSGSADYVAEVKAALDAWDGSGSFVFTSSNSVCSVTDGGTVTEDSPLVPLGAGPGTDRLLQAEEAVLKAGGNVVRLVGLYHCQRGAHTFFLKMGQVPRPAEYVVNLIHYEDAASLAHSILQGDGTDGAGYRGQVFLGCDNHPLTFKDMMDACTSSGVFQGEVTFTAPLDPKNSGKYVNNDASRKRLGWQPKYSSFKAFMAAGGKDFYNTSGLF